MTMFPQTMFLKIPMISSISIGMFPREFLVHKSIFEQKCYVLYSRVMFGFYIFYLTTSFIKLYELSSQEDPRMEEIAGILCTTLLYIITVIRQLILRFQTGLRNIIRQIVDTEKVIYAQDNQEVIDIYKDYVKDTNRKCIIYPLTIYLTTSLYMLRPLVVPGYEKQIGNQTVFIKVLPIINWVPVDEQTYYAAAYLWQIIFSFLGAAFVSYTDILMFSLIVYPTALLRILQYVLKNFKMYKKKIQNQLKIDEKTAAFVTFRECIKHHKNIIRYVDYFNDSMNTLMIFDFLQSSLQIATVLTQVLALNKNEITLMLIVCVGAYFTGMILRLFMYYHYANEIILLSSGLAGSVWDIDWYEQPPNVKFMMLIFMRRAQKSLQLQIGPFSVMSLESLIAILKAAYSYITLIFGTN